MADFGRIGQIVPSADSTLMQVLSRAAGKFSAVLQVNLQRGPRRIQFR